MKLSVPFLISAGLLFGMASAQRTDRPTAPPSLLASSSADDVQQLNADVQRLKILLNQMRTNLGFVQTTQSPLKHQFELEVDAWQVVIDQMERRLKQMEAHPH